MDGPFTDANRTGGHQEGRLIVLGIETSCDETAAAISQDGRILSSQVSTQTIHRKYGGVVPEIASREHEKLLNEMVVDTLQIANLSKADLDGIAVTQGPGLSGTLITGVCFAKGLAQGLQLPIIGVNHLEAHIFANFLADPALTFPFICLLVSGGHTQIWYVDGLGDYDLMGETRDDAGYAYDRISKSINAKSKFRVQFQRIKNSITLSYGIQSRYIKIRCSCQLPVCHY